MNLRKATIKDSELLLAWANDPIVRQNSFNTHHISRKDHEAWFSRILNSSDTDIFILCDEQPIGTVRIRYDNDIAELSYSIGSIFRGQGYGTTIIRFAEMEVIKKRIANYIVAEVKSENIASRHIFCKLGYSASVGDGQIKFEKKIKEVVGFRVDANKQIATGHAMRCITYAKECEKQGMKAVFFVADDDSRQFVESYGMSVIVLNSKFESLDDETEEIIQYIKDYKVSQLIIDSYYVTKKYLSLIRKAVRTVYVDDLMSFDYDVDVIVNYSIYADVSKYKRLYNGNCPQLLLGIKYAPLRDEFKKVKYKVRKNIRNILITTGGGDKYNIAQSIVNYLLDMDELSDVTFHIVSGAFAEEKINNERVIVHQEVRNMATLMADSDLIISAGGFTLYEACYVGVPALSISFADNQLMNVQKFDELQLIKYCGDMRDDRLNVLQKIALELSLMSREIRQEKHKVLLSFVSHSFLQ